MPQSTQAKLLLLGILAAVACMVWGAWEPNRWPLFVASSVVTAAFVAAAWYQNIFTTRAVLVVGLVLRLCFAPMPPMLSDDAYRYIWDGVVQVQEGDNPYQKKPEAYVNRHDEVLYERLNSKEYYSVYPPVSQLVFAVGGLVYPYGWEVSFYVIKAILVLFECAALFLLARLVSARQLLLYAWHPVVLVETAGQAHTESIMVLFLIVVVWAIQKKRDGIVGIALALAGWVKLYPLVLFPLLQVKKTTTLFFACTMLGVGAIYAAPYVLPNVRTSLDLYVALFEYNAGLYYAIKETLRWWTGDDWSKWLGPRLRLLFLASLPVYYYLRWRFQWPFWQSAVLVLGTYFVLTTTIHPWYFLAILPLTVFADRPAWHWHWVSLVSLGTYLFYIGGPYWSFVILGWGGWLVLAIWRNHGLWLQALQRFRARRKYEKIRPFLPKASGAKVLDLGAGEGYVGEVIAREHAANVELLDVVDYNQTTLPFTCYDGQRIPKPDLYYDAVVLYFVLHHAEDAVALLREACRVSRHVIIVESTYTGAWDLRVLTALDKLANRIRSGRLMDTQEEHLHFRTVEGWHVLFRALNMQHVEQRRWGRIVHKEVLFALEPRAPTT